MMEDFSVLQSIIENSGREGYITDEKFNVLWTNSDKSLIEILLSSNHSNLIQPKRKETAIACADGSALKITPLMSNGKTLGYMFERYTGNQVVELLSKTSVFKEFYEQYNGFREATFEMMTYLQSQATADTNGSRKDDIDKILSGSVNKVNLMKILNYDSEPQIFDLYLPVSYCCGLLQLAAKDADVEITTDIQQGLYVSAHHSAFEYVLMNQLLNAYGYCDAAKKKIHVAAFRKKEKVVLEISDNGKNCDLKRINSFRSLFGTPRGETSGEGLGIAAAQIFADKYDCELEFSNSETGGLRIKITFPYQIPDSRVSLFSPSADRDESSLLGLMLKCFTSDDLNQLKSRITY